MTHTQTHTHMFAASGFFQVFWSLKVINSALFACLQHMGAHRKLPSLKSQVQALEFRLSGKASARI